MRKDQIAKSYIEHCKKQYPSAYRAWKHRVAIVTGAEKDGSIGNAIGDMLSGLPYMAVYTPTQHIMDVRSADDCYAYLNGMQGADTLICSHGVNYMGWFEDIPIGDITNVIDINLIGSARLAQAFVKRTIDLPWRKQIIFIGSMAYRNVLNASSVYCASKAGLAMLTRCLAWELAPKGFDVFCVHPSNTEGAPMSEDTIRGIMDYRHITREEAEAYWGAVLPRHRWLQPEDIANTIKHLLTDESGYLSGANIELAGGQR